jgi:hypothetical protein
MPVHVGINRLHVLDPSMLQVHGTTAASERESAILTVQEVMRLDDKSNYKSYVSLFQCFIWHTFIAVGWRFMPR